MHKTVHNIRSVLHDKFHIPITYIYAYVLRYVSDICFTTVMYNYSDDLRKRLR
jgi:hypothetical protein